MLFQVSKGGAAKSSFVSNINVEIEYKKVPAWLKKKSKKVPAWLKKKKSKKKYLLGRKVEENDAKVKSDSKNADNPKVDGACMEHLEKNNI